MTDCNYYLPIDVRYGDLDPQGHVNNAKFITYLEHARISYWRHLSLFQAGSSFLEIGVILADLQITFLAPILWEDKIKVGIRATHLGNKSMTFHQCIVDQQNGKEYATSKVILVAYDYHQGVSVPIPQEWRKIIQEFDHL
ncbi:MAG: thioesterase family protein [Anaerolineales bacterium]|jgi:acyl-CoA thioester hydrolase